MFNVVTGLLTVTATTMNQKIERNMWLKRGSDTSIRAGTPAPPTSRIKLIIGTITVEQHTTPPLSRISTAYRRNPERGREGATAGPPTAVSRTESSTTRPHPQSAQPASHLRNSELEL